ncbi:MAG: MFS transporter [Deltaproteobacteria bacterium]|nr:MFS transporter [Deltaproteobacteria bacterium]
MLKGHPKGLMVLFFANMGERFGYYTMLSIFVLYIQSNFGWDAETSGRVYGAFLFGIYFMPLLGGWLADKVLGYGKTVALGTIIMTLGYALLAIPTDTALFVYGSLAVICIGNGLFKGNLVVIVGNLYGKDKGSLRDAAFNIYYMGINIGAFFAPYAATAIGDYMRESFGATMAEGYNAGFAVAGLGQILSLVVFLALRKYYKDADYRAHEKKGSDEEEELTPKQSRDRVVALMIIFAIVIFFWMAFHQNGFTMTLFAKNYTVGTVSPLTYMLFNLPALLSIIAIILGLVFALKKGTAAWLRGVAVVLVVGGGAFAAYKYTSFQDHPTQEVVVDRMSDVGNAQAQKEAYLNRPLSAEAKWVDKIDVIPEKTGREIAERLRADGVYTNTDFRLPLLTIYRVYNDRILTKPYQGEGADFFTTLNSSNLSGAGKISALYRKVSAAKKTLAKQKIAGELEGTSADIIAQLEKQTATDEQALWKQVMVLGDKAQALRLEREEKQDGMSDEAIEKLPADPMVQKLEPLFVVAQHLARLEEEALLVARQSVGAQLPAGEEVQEMQQDAAAMIGGLVFEANFFRELAISLSKISDRTFASALVYKVPGRISPELFQSFNPIFIVFLTPLILGLFAFLNRRKKEPSSPAKIGIGMFITALGFGLLVLASWGLQSVAELGGGRSGVLVTPYWLIMTYLTLTVAELFLSPMGLSFVSKVAPPKLRGLMQGGWLGATAIGNLLAGLVGHFYSGWELWQFFLLLSAAALMSSLAVLALLKRLRTATES